MGMMAYTETSSQEGLGVDEALGLMIRTAVARILSGETMLLREWEVAQREEQRSRCYGS